MESIKNEDVKIGQHCWALDDGKAVVVLKTKARCYEVCGGWECEVSCGELDLISIINPPECLRGVELYYLNQSI